MPGSYDVSVAPTAKRHTAGSRRLFGCLWPLRVAIDPEEQEQDRLKMLTYLGRYGRQSTFDRDWWDVELEELKQRFHALCEAVQMESRAGRKEEDG